MKQGAVPYIKWCCLESVIHNKVKVAAVFPFKCLLV